MEACTWVPANLTPAQVQEFVGALTESKIPCSGQEGRSYWAARLVAQQPPQDYGPNNCVGLSDEEKREMTAFNEARKMDSLDIGMVRPLATPPVNVPPDAALLSMELSVGTSLVVAPSSEKLLLCGGISAVDPTLCKQCGCPILPGALSVTVKRAGPALHWHPACFVCCVCLQLLHDLVCYWLGGMGGVGGGVYCGRHHAEQLKPRCAACDEIIFSDECAQAEGRAWHVRHFACTHCCAPLGGRRYVVRDGRHFCVPCFNRLLTDRCQVCWRVISADQLYVSSGAFSYHATSTCFFCCHCFMPLVAQLFVPRRHSLFCANCAKRAPRNGLERYAGLCARTRHRLRAGLGSGSKGKGVVVGGGSKEGVGVSGLDGEVASLARAVVARSMGGCVSEDDVERAESCNDNKKIPCILVNSVAKEELSVGGSESMQLARSKYQDHKPGSARIVGNDALMKNSDEASLEKELEHRASLDLSSSNLPNLTLPSSSQQGADIRRLFPPLAVGEPDENLDRPSPDGHRALSSQEKGPPMSCQGGGEASVLSNLTRMSLLWSPNTSLWASMDETAGEPVAGCDVSAEWDDAEDNNWCPVRRDDPGSGVTTLDPLGDWSMIERVAQSSFASISRLSLGSSWTLHSQALSQQSYQRQSFDGSIISSITSSEAVMHRRASCDSFDNSPHVLSPSPYGHGVEWSPTLVNVSCRAVVSPTGQRARPASPECTPPSGRSLLGSGGSLISESGCPLSLGSTGNDLVGVDADKDSSGPDTSETRSKGESFVKGHTTIRSRDMHERVADELIKQSKSVEHGMAEQSSSDQSPCSLHERGLLEQALPSPIGPGSIQGQDITLSSEISSLSSVADNDHTQRSRVIATNECNQVMSLMISSLDNEGHIVPAGPTIELHWEDLARPSVAALQGAVKSCWSSPVTVWSDPAINGDMSSTSGLPQDARLIHSLVNYPDQKLSGTRLEKTDKELYKTRMQEAGLNRTLQNLGSEHMPTCSQQECCDIAAPLRYDWLESGHGMTQIAAERDMRCSGSLSSVVSNTQRVCENGEQMRRLDRKQENTIWGSTQEQRIDRLRAVRLFNSRVQHLQQGLMDETEEENRQGLRHRRGYIEEQETRLRGERSCVDERNVDLMEDGPQGSGVHPPRQGLAENRDSEYGIILGKAEFFDDMRAGFMVCSGQEGSLNETHEQKSFVDEGRDVRGFNDGPRGPVNERGGGRERLSDEWLAGRGGGISKRFGDELCGYGEQVSGFRDWNEESYQDDVEHGLNGEYRLRDRGTEGRVDRYEDVLCNYEDDGFHGGDEKGSGDAVFRQERDILENRVGEGDWRARGRFDNRFQNEDWRMNGYVDRDACGNMCRDGCGDGYGDWGVDGYRDRGGDGYGDRYGDEICSTCSSSSSSSDEWDYSGLREGQSGLQRGKSGVRGRQLCLQGSQSGSRGGPLALRGRFSAPGGAENGRTQVLKSRKKKEHKRIHCSAS